MNPNTLTWEQIRGGVLLSPEQAGVLPAETECIVVHRTRDIVFRRPGSGVSPMLMEAFVYSVVRAMSVLDNRTHRIDYGIYVGGQEREGPTDPMVERLGAGLVEDLKLAPMNPQFRTLVMARTGHMPPDHIDTFELLREWMSSLDLTDLPAPPPALQGDPIFPDMVVQELATAIEAAPPARRLRFSFTVNDTEVGTARYRVRREGSSEVVLTMPQLDEMVLRDGMDSLDELLSRMNEIAESIDAPPDMEWTDDGADYDRHEAVSFDDRSWEFDESEASRRRALERFILTHGSPETIQRFRLRREEGAA